MAPKEETSQGASADGVTGESKMVDVSANQEDISSAGTHYTKGVNHPVIISEVLKDVCNISKTNEEEMCKGKSLINDVNGVSLEEPSSDTSGEGNLKQGYLKNIVGETNRNAREDRIDELSSSNDPNSCSKEGSLTMSLCVAVAEGTALPAELWHAAIRKEPVNVWILQVADSELSPDCKTSPLQVVLPLDQTWSWGSQLDPVSMDDEEPLTYTTLQTVNWDDAGSCHSSQMKETTFEGPGSSVFSDDEEMSSMAGDNFHMVGSDNGLRTSSSDGDLRTLLQAGMASLDDSWSEDVNTFALTELRLGSDADSRCSIDTERQTDPSPSVSLSGSKEHFSCPLCHKTFTDQLNFKYHKRTHKDRKLFTCDCCNQKFAREKTLERHRLTHSVPVRPLLIDCPVCGESFDQRAQLRMHLRSMHRDESLEVADNSRMRRNAPFMCEICRKTFAHETRLKHHQAAHYERQYKCHICTVTLATKHSLRRHLYIHSGQKPFCCKTCGKAFAFELYLRNHMKKHLTFKLHDCAFCPERFCSRRELKTHLQIHRGQYHCQVCKQSFRSKHKLQEHMQVHET